MALDGTTLQNLEVLTNSTTFTTAGSLWSKINGYEDSPWVPNAPSLAAPSPISKGRH